MAGLAEVRKDRGISQRALAARARISFRGLQLLEEPGHNWRFSSMARVAGALHLPSKGLEFALERFLHLTNDSIEDISIRMTLDGFDSWKTHLFNFVDAFRAGQESALVHRPPIPELNDRLGALVASTTEALCRETGICAPDWCRGIPPLTKPWFVAGVEGLKASALIESAPWFRTRNIFVLKNFLDRA